MDFLITSIKESRSDWRAYDLQKICLGIWHVCTSRNVNTFFFQQMKWIFLDSEEILRVIHVRFFSCEKVYLCRCSYNNIGLRQNERLWDWDLASLCLFYCIPELKNSCWNTHYPLHTGLRNFKPWTFDIRVFSLNTELMIFMVIGNVQTSAP